MRQPSPRLICACALILQAHSVSPARAQTSEIGQWSAVQQWPVEAIHTFMLPTGKVLFWQTWRESVGIWNPSTNQFETAGFTAPGANPLNPFCSGHAWLDDGRLLIAGGHVGNANGDNRADIYDPFTNKWASADPAVPNVPVMGPATSNPASSGKRWYPSATTLGNGDVLVMSGDVVPGVNGEPEYGNTNRTVQIYRQATNSWETLTGALRPASDLLPEYPRPFLAPDGRILNVSDKNDDTEFLSLAGNGSWSFLSKAPDWGLHNYGPGVMYDTGRIAYFGGGDNPTHHINLIDLNDPTPHWTRSAEHMAQPRRQNNATILADGTVLITGGSSKSGFNDPTGFIPAAELWNPDTQEVTTLASASSIFRGYHSTALLLPDGRVLVTGGNHDDATGYVEQKNAEIYSPPYLFDSAGAPAVRPTVTAAPDVVEMGDTIYVETPDAADIAKALWIVPGAVTHAQNWTQRANVLDFTLTDGGLNIELPPDTNHAPAGYYMLFLVNTAGVPSVAEWVRATTITPNAPNADFNGDLMVDGADLLTLQRSLYGPAGRTHAEGDANDDGAVDVADYDIWFAQFATTPVATGVGSAIPEPASVMLAAVAAAALGAMLRGVAARPASSFRR